MRATTSSGIPISRRRLLLLAGSACGSLTLSRPGYAGPDQGIGGTGAGARPVDEESDRGIGGTGVIGTIRKFGSIFVNDLRIAYPENASVFIDGQPATPAALAIGQVVRVVAHRDGDKFSTQTIDVSSEVVGPIERVGAKSLTVLGQSVSTATLGGVTPFTLGDHVAISGLRRTDGVIVASLIERREDGLYKVAGRVQQARDGGLRIGGLRVTGIGGDLIGQRAIVVGTPRDGGLAVTRSTNEMALFPSDVTRLSVEAYVARRGDRLTLGSGLVVGGAVTSLPEGRGLRSVLVTSIGSGGRLDVRSLQSGGTRYQATPRDEGLERGPGGTRPMDFERPLDGGQGRDGARARTPSGRTLGSPPFGAPSSNSEGLGPGPPGLGGKLGGGRR